MPLSKEYILTLLKTPKIGPVSVKAINAKANFNISGLYDLYNLIAETRISHATIPLPDLLELEKAFIHAQQVMEQCDKKNIAIITANDAYYPKKLLRLSDYPIVTYLRGNIDAINATLSAAVIGTREPSPFGFKMGRRVSTLLAKNGFSIISGLAIGCDTAGHLGALDIQAPTVAVLASGVDIIYPKENTALAEKIIDQGGALFSEYEVGFRPQKSTFVERDRLQSGLSDGLLVIETDVQGGTMHAVKAAKKMNMTVGCVSNHPESLKDFSKIRGNKMLINEGALPIDSPEQIWNFIKKMNPAASEFINNEKARDAYYHQAIPASPAIIAEAKEGTTLSNTPSYSNKKEAEIKVTEVKSQQLPNRPGDTNQTESEKRSGEFVTNEMLMISINELKDMITKMAIENQLLKTQVENALLTGEKKTLPTKSKKKQENQAKLL